MKDIVIVNGTYSAVGLEELCARCDVRFPHDGGFTDDEYKSASAILAMGRVTKEQIDISENLKLICAYGAGYDRVDIAAASAKGIPVCNIPDATSRPTAELTMAILLSAVRRVTETDRYIRRNIGPVPTREYMGETLEGLTLGIIGFGRIGRTLARLASAFGMKIIYSDVAPSEYGKELEARFMPMDELLKTADVISVHCPLNESTRGLIGREEFEMMKQGAVFVNASRGGTADYDALADALKSGKLAYAALDVYPNEPAIPEVFLGMENVVLTPHIGTNTHKSRENMARACARSIMNALEGRPVDNIVNSAEIVK